MTVAAVDIGTNSMRLLIVAVDGTEIHREVVVTGLGTGLDATGMLDEARMAETLEVMSEFGLIIRRSEVQRTAAVATSASRDASNGAEFISAVADRLGVMPVVVDGAREAELSFAGATAGYTGGASLVIDIGGGSTEFIVGRSEPTEAVSIDMGSVRLTDRALRSRPVPDGDLALAGSMVDAAFSDVPHSAGTTVYGVGGTFTSLAAIALGLDQYDRSAVSDSRLTRSAIDTLVGRLAAMSIEATAAIPSLHPRRAPVILGSAIVASGALMAVGAEVVIVREADLLDALAAELLGGALT